MMRIALNSIQINQLNRQDRENPLPNLKVGDVVLAEIVSLDGESATLKTREGAIIVARLLSNINLLLGDNIELMVSSKEGETYVMQNLSLESGVIDNTTGRQQTTFINEGKTYTAIVNTLKNLGVTNSPQLVDNIVNIMSEHGDVNVKTAVFMALNNIPVSEENISLLSELTGNENIGKDLFDIMNQVVDKEGTLINTQTAQPQTNISQAVVDNTPNLNVTSNTVVAQEVVIENGVMVGDNIVPNTTVEQPNIEQVLVGSNISAVQDNVTVTTIPQETEQVLQQNVEQIPYNNVDSEQVIVNNQYTTKHVVQKVISMFAGLEEIKEDETKLKQAGEELNQKLDELKELVKNSDIRNREDIVTKTDNIIAKNKMASDINRFTYMQIPINYNNEQKAAELYVYNRKKSKKNLDPSNVVMLIGLDTQNIGRVETAIKVQSKNVSLKICSENTRALEMLRKRSIGLKKVLGEIGYLLSDVKVERLFEKTTVVNAEEVLSRLDQKSSSIVDYKV